MKRLSTVLGVLLVFSLFVASPVGPSRDTQLPRMSTAAAALISAAVILLPAVPVLLAARLRPRHWRWATAYGTLSAALSAVAVAIYWWSQRTPMPDMACTSLGPVGGCTVAGTRLPAASLVLLIVAGLLWLTALAIAFIGPYGEGQVLRRATRNQLL